MKNTLLAVTFLVMTLLVSCGAQSEEAAAIIELDERLHDFGEVSGDTVLTHTFTFTNSGSDTLIIESVSASCGCTAALLSEKAVAPGEKGDVKVSLNTRGKRGKVRQSVDIFSNNKDSWYVTVFVEAMVAGRSAQK